MKNKVQLIISLFFGFTSLVILFPSASVDAAKLESGVTINATSTTDTEKICDDGKDNDNDGKIDGDDGDCATIPTGPAAGTCGLQIVSGVPVYYGQLNVGQESAEQKVTIKNEGNTIAKIMIKGDVWMGLRILPKLNLATDEPYGSYVASGPEPTKVAMDPNVDYNNKKSLSKVASDFGQIPGGQLIPVYFQLKVPATGFSGSLDGSLTQDITLDLIC